MNQLHLGWRLGAVSPTAFQRYQYERLTQAIQPQPGLVFTSRNTALLSSPSQVHGDDSPDANFVAHQAGVNCLAIGDGDGRILISGGADASIHLWDLESRPTNVASRHTYQPSASLTRRRNESHVHAITSLSIYPFDPVPTTLLSTAHDKTFKLTSIMPSSLTPAHTFALDYAPYTHSISPIPSTSPLVAIGTAHPAIRLFDLRSGLGTHSLPGHNGAIYSLDWSPTEEHILASGGADGKVLFFDVRRANAVFACLDIDDAIGVLGDDTVTGFGSRKQLDWNVRAHNGAVTGVLWTAKGEKMVTAGHDQRIRVWDMATGRNDLVHFGPRIRNERIGELKPLISPTGCGKYGKELLLWPNDDAKGDILVHDMREGNLLRILRTEGVNRAQAQQGRQGSIGKLTSGGRINALVWRWRASSGNGVEMYSAHGDGRICAWVGLPEDENEVVIERSEDNEAAENEAKRKRKRDLVSDLVEGLTKRPMTFS